MKQRQFKRIKYKTMRITPWRAFPEIKLRQRQAKRVKMVFIEPSKRQNDLFFVALDKTEDAYNRAILEHADTLWSLKEEEENENGR